MAIASSLSDGEQFVASLCPCPLFIRWGRLGPVRFERPAPEPDPITNSNYRQRRICDLGRSSEMFAGNEWLTVGNSLNFYDILSSI